MFDEFPDDRRIAYGDAKFIDAIHTSIIGTQRRIGDADFWVNGGRSQTGYLLTDQIIPCKLFALLSIMLSEMRILNRNENLKKKK